MSEWDGLRPPSKVSNYIRILVHGDSGSAIVSIVGADGDESIQGGIRKILVFDT